MDELELSIENVGQRELITNSHVVTIYVNGRRFTDLVRDIELPLLEAEQPEEEREDLAAVAGNYVGLLPEEVFFPSRHLLGEAIPEPLQQYNLEGRSTLMLCHCGLAACNALTARIVTEQRRIIWQDFSNPQRPLRDYSALGRFVFDRTQYLKALRFPEHQLS